ncbi:MAG TPA: cupredoxin domain-containing protein [Actinomycetota bacterium]|nr:cupredoxin domain-containing protein [Actinomycetota bacterium]
MRRTTLPLIAVLTLAGAACGGPGIVIRSGPTENVFVPQVVDFEDAPGRGVSLAVDAEGNPHLAYLAFESNAKAGGPAEQADPNAPKLPAVRHAHLIEGIWTRSVVADNQQALGGGDTTAIAVDAEGVHHVAWTAGDSLFYSNNAEGAEFSKPEEVAADVIGGLSVAADGGRVAISFFESGGGGPGPLVRVAVREGTRWTVETAAEVGRVGEPATAVGFDGDTILVAFGDSGQTILARSGATWTSEVADADGGRGVSMDVDKDGNPHLAYATSEGQVKHAHSIGRGPWEVSEVGVGANGPTSIAVDDQGIHHVAWQTRTGLSYASDEGGEFKAEEVPGTRGAELPRVGAGAERTLYLAWFEPAGSGLVLAIRSDREPLLAIPSPSVPSGGPTGPPTGPPPCEPSGTSLSIAAPPGASGTGFDQTCLAVPAGKPFTVDFANDDNIPHNWALYTDDSASEHLGGGSPSEPIAGGQSKTYEVDPIDDPGQYFYRCDFHPTTMTGTFVVQ